jgi:hypothetical protein
MTYNGFFLQSKKAYFAGLSSEDNEFLKKCIGPAAKT